MADATAGLLSVHAVATTCSFSPIARQSLEKAANCALSGPRLIPYSPSRARVRDPSADWVLPVSRPPASGM